MSNKFSALSVGLGFLFLMGAVFAALSVGANFDALHDYSGQLLRSATDGTTLYPFQDRYLGTGYIGQFAPVVLTALGMWLIIYGFQNLSPDD